MWGPTKTQTHTHTSGGICDEIVCIIQSCSVGFVRFSLKLFIQSSVYQNFKFDSRICFAAFVFIFSCQFFQLHQYFFFSLFLFFFFMFLSALFELQITPTLINLDSTDHWTGHQTITGHTNTHWQDTTSILWYMYSIWTHQSSLPTESC